MEYNRKLDERTLGMHMMRFGGLRYESQANSRLSWALVNTMVVPCCGEGQMQCATTESAPTPLQFDTAPMLNHRGPGLQQETKTSTTSIKRDTKHDTTSSHILEILLLKVAVTPVGYMTRCLHIVLPRSFYCHTSLAPRDHLSYTFT